MKTRQTYNAPRIEVIELQYVSHILAESNALGGPSADYMEDPDIVTDCEIKGEIEGGTSFWE